MSIVACDIDLLRIHAWSDTTGRVCYNAANWPLAALAQHETILVEIASAQNTSKKASEAYNRRRWAIGNSFQLGRYSAIAEHLLDRTLVSPSTKWTLGHPEPLREQIAMCAKQDNHDIRACRCMIAYFRTNPEKWTPIRQWMGSAEEQI